MTQSAIFTFIILTIQIVLHIIISLKLLPFKLNRRVVVYIAIVVFTIAPWIIPSETYLTNRNLELEGGTYFLGIKSLFHVFWFWVIANTVSVIIAGVFHLSEKLLNK